MITPSPRLLFWTAIVALPFLTLAAVEPQWTALSAVAIAALALVALVDAARALDGLKGLTCELADVVRASKDREAHVELRLHNETARPRTIRLGLAFPPEIESPYIVMQTLAPADAPQIRLFWPFTAKKRGNYRLDRVFLEGPSPCGLWAVRGAQAVRSEIRVYPNLLRERRQLAALFLNRGTFGLHAQRQVGQGREFEKLREYIPGDSYDDIHWKATAKRGRPVTKLHQIERTQEIYVIVDASRLSARTVRQSDGKQTIEVTYLERFMTAALVLGLVAERQGDLFGLLTFSDRVRGFVRAKSGKAHYNACRDALYTLEPRIVNPDFDELFAFLRLRLRRRALLFFLTNLDDTVLAESFVRNVELVRRQHLVLTGMLSPPGVRPLFTNPALDSADDLYRELAGHMKWHELRELERVLYRLGVTFLMMENERLCAEVVTQYINVKRRQLL